MEPVNAKKILGIDQSLNATGLCLLEEGRIVLRETHRFGEEDGLTRLDRITSRVGHVLEEHNPLTVVMEDYARQAKSASLVPLVELGGCLKWIILKLGYSMGREAIMAGQKLLRIQNQSSMKKFMLGHGNITKDSRYLLAVFERIQIAFEDDNQADAYMHAWMTSIVLAVLQGKVSLENLPRHQVEALISAGANRKKGLSLTKAMKLPASEQLKLVGF